MSEKIAVVTDSNSGITQEQGKELGVYVLPMPVLIDGKEYFENVNLSQEEFYRMMENGADITTSQPSPESVTQLWDKLLETHDKIIHIPMSSGLTGSVQTAKMLAQDYSGAVFVVDNHRISVTQRQSVMDAKAAAAAGWEAERIARFLEETGRDSSIYIMLDTLKYLRKGGRITPAAAALGTLLRLKPVLQIQGDKLDAFAKARTIKQGKKLMLQAIQHDCENRFGTPDGSGLHLEMAHTMNDEEIQIFRDEFAELFPGQEIYIDPLPLSIAVHIGPGSLAVAVSKRFKFDGTAGTV